MELDQILGKTKKILGTDKPEVYEQKIQKMSRDEILAHGRDTYGIVSNFELGRKNYEDRLMAAFKKKLTNGVTIREPEQKPKKGRPSKQDKARAKALDFLQKIA
jgi:hypothetical protein